MANYKPRMLANVKNVGGYFVASVTINGKKTCCLVHVMVAAAFIGPKPDSLLVLHRNGDKNDNRAGNLYYGTQRQNIEDSIKHGTKARGVTHGMVKIAPDVVHLIRSLSNEMSQREIARHVGLGQSQVHRIIARQSWAHIGAGS